MSDTSRSLENSPDNWQVGTSTAAFGQFTAEILDECKHVGLNCIELGLDGDDLAERSLTEGARRVDAIKKHGLELWSVHLPFGRNWDVSSLDVNTRMRSRHFLADALVKAASWGAKVAVIHPGAEPVTADVRIERIHLSIEGLTGLHDVAKQVGIRLAAECLPRTCLGNCSDEMHTLLQSVDGLEATLDVNHALKEPAHHMAAKLGDKIATVHMSDYDGIDERHWLPGQGIINWQAVMAALVASGYLGPFMFEVGHKKYPGGVTPSVLMNCWQTLLAQYHTLQLPKTDHVSA